MLWNHFTNNGVLRVNAFHEKAGRSQVGRVVFSLDIGFLSCRVATVATLPSALSMSHPVGDRPSHPICYDNRGNKEPWRMGTGLRKLVLENDIKQRTMDLQSAPTIVNEA